MADDSTNPTEWASVAEAAAGSTVPERTLFRWAKAKAVPSRTEGGVTLVDVAAVRAKAAARAAAGAKSVVPLSATAGSTAGGGSGNGSGGTPAPGGPTRLGPTPEPDGELAARVFAEFDEGATPAEVVVELRLPAPVVLGLWNDHQRLSSLGGARTGQITIPERVEAIEKQLAHVWGHFNEDGGSMPATIPTRMSYLEGEVVDLANRVFNLKKALAELPVPTRAAFACTCGATGLVEVPVRCAACGREVLWGFHLPEKK